MKRGPRPNPALFVVAAYHYPLKSEYETPAGRFVRTIAHDLKSGDPIGVHYAAAAMAPLVPRGATLIPIPGSKGSTRENLRLAEAIAKASGAKVMDGLERMPSESQYARRKRGLRSFTAGEQHVRWIGGHVRSPIVLIDNVVTSGATAEAARRAIGGDAVSHAAS